MTNTMKNFTPPYISLPKMDELFALLSSRSFSNLSIEDLTARGFSRSDASQGLQGLKFLGFVDEKGKVNDSMRVLSLKGEERGLKLQDIIKLAYKKLYERVQNPELLSKDNLYNEFIAEYNLSARLTRTAVPAFLWLCKESGMNITEEIIQKKSPSTRKTKQRAFAGISKRDKKPSMSIPDRYFELDLSGVVLRIPKNPKVDLAIATGGLSEITAKILEFAKKVEIIPSKTEGSDRAIDNKNNDARQG